MIAVRKVDAPQLHVRRGGSQALIRSTYLFFRAFGGKRNHGTCAARLGRIVATMMNIQDNRLASPTEETETGTQPHVSATTGQRLP
jgi:hypothetical protein